MGCGGLDEGVATMKVGNKRSLIFEIELLDVKL
jgi:FKBP-type peptidyl-prolyl cis-trans isomerase